MKFFNIIIYIFVLFFIKYAFSIESKKIKIIGNQYIDNEIIFSIIEDKLTDYSNNNLNEIIKVLYATGNFKKIEIENLENQIILRIEENPSIRKISFIGNKRFDEEAIFEIFKKEKYFATFNEIKINKFINDFTEVYSSFGYNMVKFEYELDNLEDNFIDLNFIVSEGKISKINKIFFIGHTSFSHSTLSSKIKSKQKNLLMFYRNSNFKKYQIKEDQRRLINFYKNNGFKDINISQQTEFISSSNRFNVYFYIDEGEKYQFRNIDINLQNLNLSDSDNNNLHQLSSDFILQKLTKNKTYNLDIINILKNRINEYLFDIGVVFFDILTLEKIENTNVDIKLQFVTIEPNYVNQINIYGNQRTKDKVIRREIPFSEGDAINNELIRVANRNLNNLGIFKSVSTNQINNNINSVDFEINIEEKSTGQFKVGVALDSFEGATFLTGLTEKNIMGDGRELSFDINTASSNTKYNFGIVEPYIFNKKADFIYNLGYSDKNFSSSSYNLVSFNNNIGFRYSLTDEIKHSIILQYILKDYTITNEANASDSVKELAGNNADILLNNIFTNNKLDSFIRPTKGSYLSFSNGFSPVTNNKNGYLKNIISYKKYYKYKDNIYSFRTKLGNIFSLQNKDLPNDNKFALGGRSLRGFDAYGVGPRDSSTSYVGGKNIIVSNFDLHRPLVTNADNPIDLNLFIDVGTVFDNKVVPSSSKETIRSSFGFGIKFYSPIGPIGLTWGFPITKESYDIERRFIFSIGNLN